MLVGFVATYGAGKSAFVLWIGLIGFCISFGAFIASGVIGLIIRSRARSAPVISNSVITN